MRNLSELIEPQFGKKRPQSQPQVNKSSTSPSDIDGDGSVDSFEKKVRQLIYDVRHLEKTKHIPTENAFDQRTDITNYPPEVVKAAREKLGIKSSVAEANIQEGDGENMISVVIRYNNGTTDRRSVTRSEIQRLRSQPNVSSVELTKYGIARKDYDNDGKIESGKDEHAGSVHNAIQKRTGGVADGNPPTKRASKKKMRSYGVSEGFSNWREELFEIADDGLSSDSKDKIKEKKVNNYVGKKPVVEISPTIGMKESVEELGGELLEMEDISEDYLIEDLYSNEIAVAAQYFCEQGLNEYGIDILIKKLGVDEFCNYVEDIAEDYCLVEWRRGPGGTKIRGEQTSKGGKHISTLKGAAKSSAIRGTAEHKARKAEAGSTDSGSSGMTAALKSQSDKARRVATKTAEVKQPKSEKEPEETKKEVKKGIFGALKDRAARDTELLKKSWQTAREVGKGHEKRVAAAAGTVAGAVHGAAKAAHTAGKKAGESEAGKKVKSALAKTGNAAAGAANDAIDARSSGKSAAATAGRAVGGFVRRMRGSQNEQFELLEKITGKTDIGVAIKDFQSSTSSRLAGRSKKQRGKAAIAAVLTARRGGKKLGEDMDPKTSQQISAQNKKIKAEKELSSANQKALQKLKKDEPNPEVKSQSKDA
jgi:hypothetical protein